MIKRTPALTASGAVLAMLALAACGSSGEPEAADTTTGAPGSTTAPAADINEPLVATYDGGLYVLDGETLEVQADIPMDGFLRVNPVGDDTHVMVTVDRGFQLLDAKAGQLTDVIFEASEPGHVVPHGEHTVLFADGTGEITVFDPHDLGDGMPQTQTMAAPEAHHGVAIVLEDGTLVRSESDGEERIGAVAIDAGGVELARNDDCPGLHGETVAAPETVVFGCENGILAYVDGAFTKIDSPDAYGRSGNIKGHQDSPVVLGDYKVDPDADLERPNQFALANTETGQLQIVQLPEGVSYTFRSLGRGPHGEAMILGTDGNLHIFDPVTGAGVRSIAVTAPWSEPDEWQQPRPTVFTRGHDVYVTDTASGEIHLVDIEAGEVTSSVTLDNIPNELSGAVGHEH